MVSHVTISQLLACLSTSLEQAVFAVVVPSCQKVVDNFSHALHECLNCYKGVLTALIQLAVTVLSGR